ncbi:MAG: hypothetical protein WD066_06840 [Planctomycetaceae bacterium]
MRRTRVPTRHSRVLLPMAMLAAFACGMFRAARADDAPPRGAAEQQAIAEIRGHGGSVMELAQNDSRLVVAYHLADGEVIDEKLAPLAKLTRVVELNLRGTEIGDDGLAHVAGLNTLVRLHLEKTKIGDAGLDHLKGLENLEYLNLYGTQITDAGLARLAGMKKLKRLYVWETPVTDAGIERLKKSLPELAIIRGASLPAAETKQEETKPDDQ